MENLEEAIRNIDVFCRILVKKIVQDEEFSQSVTIEPFEDLIRRKYIVTKDSTQKPSASYLIPLPHVAEPLIDIFENREDVRILMQFHCKNENVTIKRKLTILEICADECRKVNLPMDQLRFENMTVRCKNDVLEIAIPKIQTPVPYST